ncbi:unnamed protein product [Rhizoctonia solani]|uniref:BTB domain-containing protein n=1 Tax=Rhizoctonia solani TaxID=456999 RepID=A0A8H3D149_9AGAM|nr:unnamed protein product [Rhizoctonia solani]
MTCSTCGAIVAYIYFCTQLELGDSELSYLGPFKMSEDHMAEDKLTRHPKYFHPTGDIVFQAQAVLFRVHREILCKHSEVFKDMFDLACAESAKHLSATPSDDNTRIVLHDNPDELALLFAFIYRDPIDPENTKHCLQLALLAHKYDMPALVKHCRDHITPRLPTGFRASGYKARSRYSEDRTLIPLALRTAQLVSIPSIVPWAMYTLSVQPDSDYDLFIQSEEDRLLVQSYSEVIRALRNLSSELVENWNCFASDFLNDKCENPDPECERNEAYRAECGYVEDNSFVMESEEKNPIWKIWSLLGSYHSPGGYLCSGCKYDWESCTEGFMVDAYDSIEKIVHDN